MVWLASRSTARLTFIQMNLHRDCGGCVQPRSVRLNVVLDARHARVYGVVYVRSPERDDDVR